MESNGPWKIESSSSKFENSFFKVIQDQVIQPDGQQGEYATVNIKPGVSVLPVDSEGRVYLVKQFRYALGRDSIEAVAGAINENETPLEAAQREAKEELGIEATDWLDLGQVEEDTSLVRSRGYLFMARDLVFGQPKRERTEEIQTLRMPFEEAVRRVMKSEIVHSPSALLILKTLVAVGYE